MGFDSDFGRLIERGLQDSSIPTDRVIELLLAHARHTTEKLGEAASTLDKLAEALNELAELVEQQQHELQKNTEITSAIKDAVNAGKMLHKVGKWVSAVLITLAMLWGAYISLAGHSNGGTRIDVGP